ncbi:MAG: hypothetical protein KTR29_15885 [Rhodothermaceae bacterium]|nr:hypothetical protein [Rhodothermaceae bacterium]
MAITDLHVSSLRSLVFNLEEHGASPYSTMAISDLYVGHFKEWDPVWENSELLRGGTYFFQIPP